MSSYVSLAPYYDELTRDVPYKKFADFYEEIFKSYSVKPDSILDLACGTGTLTCLLAERGYSVIGVDASEDMLVQASQKAGSTENIEMPLFVHQSMESLYLGGTVSAAVCSLDGINYVRPESIPLVFQRLSDSIQKDGIFIFDINTPEKLVSQDGGMYIDETDDVYCVWRTEYIGNEKACFYGMDLFVRQKDSLWERFQEEHTEYAHDVSFLTSYLEKAGFDRISVYGELSLNSPGEHEKRIFIAARKSEN